MEPIGKLSALNERLRVKMESDRAEIEELTKSELLRLADSLKSESERALSSTETAIRERIRQISHEMDQIGRKQRLWTLWSVAGIAASIVLTLGGLWTATGWIWSEVAFRKQELTDLRQQTTSEQATLNQLKSQTGSVRLMENQNGWFLVLPKGTDGTKIYTCNGQSCIKLGK